MAGQRAFLGWDQEAPFVVGQPRLLTVAVSASPDAPTNGRLELTVTTPAGAQDTLTTPVALAAGQSANFTISYTPDAAGDYGWHLALIDDAGATLSQMTGTLHIVPLSGTPPPSGGGGSAVLPVLAGLTVAGIVAAVALGKQGS